MRLRTALVFSIILLMVAPAARAADPDSAPAIQAMIGWIHQIDAGQYGESWDASSTLFRGTISRQKWIEALDGTRKPLGPMTSRHIESADYRRSLPGAPDGEYFVIRFGATFERKESAVETVTAMKDKGAWKAAGYFIQ